MRPGTFYMRFLDPFNVNFLEFDLFRRYSNYVGCLLFLEKRRQSSRVEVRNLMSG